MPRCSICTHPQRAEIDKALVAGEPLRSIAQRTGTSATALHRHKGGHLVSVIERATKQHAAKIERQVVALEERRDAEALDVDTELRRIFGRLTKMLDACDAWLTDAENPAVYDLNPRGNELKVTYEERIERGEREIVLRRKAWLSELLEKIEANIPNTTVVSVEHKHADPRKLLVDTANALRPSVELLAKIVGKLDESPKNVTQIQIIEIVR